MLVDGKACYSNVQFSQMNLCIWNHFYENPSQVFYSCFLLPSPPPPPFLGYHCVILVDLVIYTGEHCARNSQDSFQIEQGRMT